MNSASDPCVNHVTIREIKPDDLKRIVDLHMVVLGDEFITRLGKGFMRTYYQAFAQSSHAKALMAEIDGRPVGALLGTLVPSSHYEWMIKHAGLKLCLHMVCHSILNPATGYDVLRTRFLRYAMGVLRYVRRTLSKWTIRTTRDLPTPVTNRVADITHLFVDPHVRGERIGSALVHAYESQARLHGVSRVDLVTLPPNEGGAGTFYQRLGWTPCGTRTSRSGEKFILYTKELVQPSEPVNIESVDGPACDGSNRVMPITETIL